MNVQDWLDRRTILLVRHGSHAFGTALPTSDEDFKGVAITPRVYRDGFQHRFEQAETSKPDKVIYDLRKFMHLAADCNPSIIEALWAEPEDYLRLTPLGEQLLGHRDLFLSRKAKHTYAGYALSQLKRIRTHRRWIMTPPKEMPTRAAFGLPERTLVPKDQREFAESQIRKVLDEWNLDLSPLDDAGKIYVRERVASWMAEVSLSDRVAAQKALGFSEDFMVLLDRERRFRAAVVEFQQYENWKATRNPARHELEAQHGYDTKHAMHLVRLLRMCREILTQGKVIVRRPDAEELLSIRAGAWSYDQLIEFAEREEAEMGALEQASTMPKGPDRSRLDNLCVNLHAEADLAFSD